MDTGRLPRAARWLLVALAVAYAPIAATVAWSAFVPWMPHLQEEIDRRIGGDRYATGPGSVSALRDADYADHRVLMLLHIGLGVVCLLLAVRQVLGTPRRHRMVGRGHLALVTVSMAAALVFLVVTEPGPGAGQTAFRVQLWVLAASTLGTAWLAAFEAARGRLTAHRAWMTMHIAFLLTAPALRLTWMVLAPLVAGRDMLTNIESGAVLLAVAAPGCGVAVALRRSAGHGAPPDASRPPCGPVLMAAVAWVVGTGVVVAAAHPPPVEVHLWFHVAPSALLVIGCVLADSRVLLRGAAAMPWAVLLVSIPVAGRTDWSTGLLTGLMVAPGFPLAAALSAILARPVVPDPESPGRTSNHLPRGDVAAANAA